MNSQNLFGIGYAQVAGLPPVAGLYAAIIPLAIFAIFTSSRHLVTSPDASMAGLVGAALVAFAVPGDPLRLQYALAIVAILLCEGLLVVCSYSNKYDYKADGNHAAIAFRKTTG